MPLDIHVVDIEPRNLDAALGDWSSRNRSARHRIYCHERFDGCPEEIDLGIVATTAATRLRALADASRSLRSSFWILEKVLVQSSDDLRPLKELVETSTGAWVNTWGRTTEWYRQIRDAVRDSGPWSFRATSAESWGLGCNAIHLLDLCAWWTGERLVSLDPSGLDDRWWPSKRPGFQEPSGSLRAFFDGGSVLEMSAGMPRVRERVREPAGVHDLEVLVIEGQRGPWFLERPWSEVEGVARGPDGDTIPGRIEYQSERTVGLVDGILAAGKCDLPTVDESIDLHRPLLDALIAHWNAVTGEDVDWVPIT